MEVLDHKCPSCTAKLPFNPTTQMWDCQYCGSSYKLEELEEFEKKQKEQENKSKKSDVNADVYECPNCGAKVITDENTTATFCVYCGSTSIIKNRLTDEFRPVKIIPFANTKNEAIASFKRFKRGKLFTPKDFSDESNIEKLTGVYIPFWVYNCDVEGDINVSATKVKTWRSGNYRYTKTDSYSVKRVGNMCFEKIPVDGSIKFDDNTMDSIEPFDYKGLKDFNMSYLSGFLSEKYDVDKEESYKRAYERIKNTTINELKSTIRGYSSITVTGSNTNVDIKKTEYILLPVWMLNIKYKDKMHLFAMNGQTGKMVGNIPIDKKKMWLAWIGSFLGLTAVSSLIMFILTLFM
jgi:DNA-directed RNA polymerase subunit RPC12/RpoP